MEIVKKEKKKELKGQSTKLMKEKPQVVLDAIAQVVDSMIPNDYGFIVLTYPHNVEDRCYYVSNSDRKDVVKAMEEFIKKTKTSWGKHEGKE